MKNWAGTIQNIRRHHKQLDQIPEKYVAMDRPLSKAEERMGAARTKPAYEIDPEGSVRRVSTPEIDLRIVSACGCLPRIDVDINETETLSHLALEAVQHYARLDAVLGFFMSYQIQAYIQREKTAFQYYEMNGKYPEEQLPPEDRIRLYTGTENLLLEMILELSRGEVITDKSVRDKITSLIEDCLRQRVD